MNKEELTPCAITLLLAIISERYFRAPLNRSTFNLPLTSRLESGEFYLSFSSTSGSIMLELAAFSCICTDSKILCLFIQRGHPCLVHDHRCVRLDCKRNDMSRGLSIGPIPRFIDITILICDTRRDQVSLVQLWQHLHRENI